MPAEDYWASFFDAHMALRLLMDGETPPDDVVEFGCGYGTFTLPAAERASGVVTALDIEPDMVAAVRDKAAQLGIDNIRAEMRDFIAQGTGLTDGSQAHAMVYNLLHLERPVDLLIEARRVLRVGGRLSVMHWRSDIPTPRGPPLAMRPSPDQCKAWIAEAGFAGSHIVDLRAACPFHFGFIATC